MSPFFKTFGLPVLAAIVLYLAVSIAYFSPVMQGQVLQQHDTMVWKASAKESADYLEKHGEKTFWTNSMFSGMPTYLINNSSDGNFLIPIHRNLQLQDALRPVPFLFMYLLGFFLALLAFGVRPWLSLVGAFAFAFSSYFFIIIQAGHITKAIAIGYMAPIIAGVYLAYHKKPLWGAILTAVFLALQIIANHLQITYYTFLIILVYMFFEMYHTIIQKTWKNFFLASAFLLVGALLAIGSNASGLMLVYEYGNESIRGKSELSSDAENRTTGLDKDYATDWSYGKFESLNLLIPNLMGGASQSDLGEKSNMYEELKQMGQPNPKKIVKQMPTYWGTQPFTSGPTYIGALVIFLFVLGLFVVDGRLKWWLLSATILSLFLAWGKNMMWFTDLFLNYFPGYNKFRAVSMTLVMAELTVPLLAVLAVDKLITGQIDTAKLKKQIMYALGLTGGVVVLLLIGMSSNGSAFVNDSDAQIFGQNQNLIEAIQADRADLFQADALRSLFFILVGAALVWLFTLQKINKTVLISLMGIALLIDLWPVSKRYLNDENFVNKSANTTYFTPTLADESIMSDPSPDYRVLNIAVNTFNDATTSYYHKSIGGYHGAKMRRYQELIDHYLSKEISSFVGVLQNKPAQQDVEQALRSMKVHNMLNTKYIIYNPQAPALPNAFTNGNAWFVNELKVVNNADEEIAQLGQIDPKTTAIVDIRFNEKPIQTAVDSNATIELTAYEPNLLKYKSSSSHEQYAIFSEIYYDKGWMAYIDGKEAPHFRADYILRGMKIPAGVHEIEFKFDPPTYHTGKLIAQSSSSLLLVLLLLGMVYEWMQSRKKEA